MWRNYHFISVNNHDCDYFFIYFLEILKYIEMTVN